MNAQTFKPGFGEVRHLDVAGGLSLRHRISAGTLGATPSRAKPGTPDAVNPDQAAMLSRYRADPLAFRRAATGAARIARNHAIGAWFVRIFAIA